VSRERLPNRRTAQTFTLRHRHPNGSEVELLVSLGYFPDGRIGEVFFATDHQVGTQLDVSLKDACILLSFALQHGASPSAIRSAMTRDAQGRPEGIMGTLLDLLGEESA